MASRDKDDSAPSRAGYIGAILVSAAGHVALVVIVFFIAPHYLLSAPAAPPTYTVKIVDNLPAGDLGTHLPRLAKPKPAHYEKPRRQPPPPPPQAKAEPPKPEIVADNDKNAIALKGAATAHPTPTVTPTPAAPAATLSPTITPTKLPTAKATPTPTVVPAPEPTETVHPTPKPTPIPHHKPTAKPKPHATPKPTAAPKGNHKHKKEPPLAVAKSESEAKVTERLNELKQKLMAEHIKEQEKVNAEQAEDEGESETTDNKAANNPGGGPVAASGVREGAGYGVGPGTGSAGILQEPDFLLYYQTVQDRIKKAWTFTSGDNDLTATADFKIDSDGLLTDVKIGTSSNNAAFDESIIRAIRAAAPFPPPPKKFQSQFADGIEAEFKLGELKKSQP